MYKQILVDNYVQKRVFSQLCINIQTSSIEKTGKVKQVQNGQVYDRTDKYKIIQARVNTIYNRIYRHFNRKKRRKKKSKN